MFKFGLKLWSTNEYYVDEAIKLHEEGYYDYIELYVVSGSYEQYINVWKGMTVPYVIHASHSLDGMNLARRESFAHNMVLVKEAQQFADTLHAEMIILHPGISGDIEETVNQINKIEGCTIIENKPYYTVFSDGSICNGNNPDEIEFLLRNTNAGFCLDIGHCIYSANARRVDPMADLKRFLELKPKIFHLTDGKNDGIYDKHYHFGEGDFRITEILALLPEEAAITVETAKNSNVSLDDFRADITFLRGRKCQSIR
ncbi:MAG TPA: TIM barrel protein [Candidatus Aquicultor sp.]|jgi:sugar phosphate isomerase/epimerase